MRTGSSGPFITLPSLTLPPEAGERLIVTSDQLSGCHGDRGAGVDISSRVSLGLEEALKEDSRRTESMRMCGGGLQLRVGQGGGATGWLGEGLLQYKAHSPEVKVFGEAGGVSGARGEAVRGGAEGDHVTLRAT